jgi:L-ascorbate metabolism protein UlaG (beta-lactamase superfamily)
VAKVDRHKSGGIKIKFLGLRPSGERFKEIQNLGCVIEIGGKKILHIGDADMTAENFSLFNLSHEKIDVAFIPYWYLMSSDG